MHCLRLFTTLLALTLLTSGLLADDPRGTEQAAEENNGGERLPVVTLLDAGAEPRRELRYDVSIGSSQEIVLTFQQTASQRIGGMSPPPTRDPEVRLVVHNVASTVPENGLIRVRMRFSEPNAEADGSRPDGRARAMRALEGRTAHLRMCHRGIVQSFEVDRTISGRGGGALLVEPPPRLAVQMLRGSIIALPEAAVGEGARWRVNTAWNEGDFTPERETIYTITRMDEDGLEIKAELTAWADPQPVNVSGTAGVELVHYASEGTGRDKLVLSNVFPAQHERKAKATMAFEVDIHRIDQDVEFSWSIAPHESDEPETPRQVRDQDER